MGQWRGRRSHFTSSGYDSWSGEESREGLRLCARAVGERKNAAVRAHCRLAIHYAKRLNDRNICILAHRAALEETFRESTLGPRVSSRRTLICVIRRAATARLLHSFPRAWFEIRLSREGELTRRDTRQLRASMPYRAITLIKKTTRRKL